ncbi:MAG TPA: hypothetical protein VNW46_08255 [Gemmatimonadaceae bacterium]|jgi:hypothetical protein|nr:hypothetical protein [Gemmatimonadaceae bacterium]
MILAYAITPQDDDSFMLGEDTYRPLDSGGFYDWRFGVSGAPHPATCATCGTKTDVNFVNDQFRVHNRRRDLTATYDGYLLASKRFHKHCVAHRYPGVEFVPLPADEDFFWLRSQRTVRFDAARRGTRFEKLCNRCGSYFNIVGAHPIFLAAVSTSLTDGFYRTDIEFGSGHEQHPIVLVGTNTAAELRALNLRDLELEAVEDEHPVIR